MPVMWSPATRLHDPDGGVWVGVRIADAEVATRVDRILEAVTTAGFPLAAVDAVDETVFSRIHDRGLLDFLSGAWPAWEASGYLEDPGMNRVVAYAWTHPDMRPTPRTPRSASARAGLFATDTMTLVGPGSWEAVVAAASVAVAAAGRVLDGAPAAYALSRPPGHHAGTSFFGGSCYLNNAALAADTLASRHQRVAIVDIDAHHGNGTQQIFWDRGDVLYASVHVDPAAGWYPHYVGHADEIGGAAGSNLNLPLAPGSGDGPWLEAVARLAEFAALADALVISLGVDAEISDPESPLQITRDGYAAAGSTLGGLGVPTVIVQEGGYVLDTLGDLVVAFLSAFEEATE
jgi:acetoin utilization deacetylase AcuC-like enzyme